jgi:hypothetical protein
VSDSRMILLVGHCGPDSWALKTAVSRIVPGSEVVLVNDDRALEKKLPGSTLVLVNRVLDGSFTASSGIELIGRLSAQAGPRCMLISNFPDAQAEAVLAGAVHGFGKAEMYSARAKELILGALAAPAP